MDKALVIGSIAAAALSLTDAAAGLNNLADQLRNEPDPIIPEPGTAPILTAAQIDAAGAAASSAVIGYLNSLTPLAPPVAFPGGVIGAIVEAPAGDVVGVVDGAGNVLPAGGPTGAVPAGTSNGIPVSDPSIIAVDPTANVG